MIDITLHGILGKKLGKNWQLNVDSVYEIFEAIEANNQKVNKYFTDFKKFVSHFVVYIDGKIMPAHLLKSKMLENGTKVEILPVVQGGVTLVVIGILLIVLSIILAVVLSPKAPKDVKTNSTILGGIRNVLNRNIPVPIGYGRLRVGSAVISNLISISPIAANTAYMGALNTAAGLINDANLTTKIN